MTLLSRLTASPTDLRSFTLEEQVALAAEVRAFLIESCSVTGGHIGAGLGVVELSIALHHVFETPRDQLVWDVGHQTYGHKILTGRAEGFDRLRQHAGLSGDPSRIESAHDVIENSHASTALSYADGLAKAGWGGTSPGP